MDEVVRRCKGCRHWFTVNYRNRGRTVHPQEYCGKPTCQEESQGVSEARYRVAQPEDNEQVLARVRRWRQGRHEDAVSHRTPSSGRDSLEGSVQQVAVPGDDAVQRSAGRDVVEALARRLIQVADQMAALIAPGACYGMTELLVNPHLEPQKTYQPAQNRDVPGT